MKVNGKELKTLLNYVLIQEMDNESNPLLSTKTDSGIILASGGLSWNDQTEGSGKMETNEKLIAIGKVVETGELCKVLQIGDLVYYDNRSVRPVPVSTAETGFQGIVHTNESNIIAYVR